MKFIGIGDHTTYMDSQLLYLFFCLAPTINTNIGVVKIHEGSSQFGKETQDKMNNSEEFLRKELANKYNDMEKKVEGFEKINLVFLLFKDVNFVQQYAPNSNTTGIPNTMLSLISIILLYPAIISLTGEAIIDDKLNDNSD